MLLETDKVQIGKKIRAFRKLKKLTQFELAEEVGLNEKQISRIEMGLNYPTYTTFAKLVEVLDIDIINFVKKASKNPTSIENQLILLIKKSSIQEQKMYLNVIQAIKNNTDTIEN